MKPFEHVYLSSYLGFKLVEGDLLVREGCLVENH
jgi:uncharacterized circularly permuted ATP-grasp superfamily protein